MNMSDPNYNEKKAPIWDMEHNQPFAKRTFWNIAFLIIGALVLFAAWSYFMTGDIRIPFLGSDNDRNPNIAVVTAASNENAAPLTADANPQDAPALDQQIVQQQDPTERYDFTEQPSNPYPEKSNRNSIFDFFGHIFDDMFEGDHLTNNIDLSGTEADVSDTVQLNDYYQFVENNNADQAQFRNSVKYSLGKSIYGLEGDVVGDIHDILIHPETNMIKFLVFDENTGYDDRDLETVQFDKIFETQKDGDVVLESASDTVDTNDDIGTIADKYADYISLKSLENGVLLDFEGEKTGKIQHVIIERDKVERVYISLDPFLAPDLRGQLLSFNFDKADVVKSSEGFNIKLSTDQTFDLLKHIEFTESR